MPSILSEADKETVKRTVPKASNKIQAVAVARLYVAHPQKNRWTYTGLQGAAVLSNDLVGNTFWIKLVDISPAGRGVIWDQEIYDTFQYNQDRTFFHSFELEQCMAGLSFVDEKEAKQFKKKMDEREKNASKGTKAQPFGSNVAGGAVYSQPSAQKSHSRMGKLSLFGHRHASNPTPQPAQSMIPPPQPLYSPVVSRPQSNEIDLSDPKWRPILDELVTMGIKEEQIAQNADFIKSYIKQKQAEEMASGIAQALPSGSDNRSRAPPPPPPATRISPENTGSSSANRRGPPPAPPPSRRPVGGRAPSPPRSESPPPRTPSPTPSPQPRFRAPPPLADAGKFAVPVGRDLHPSGREPGRARASSGSNLANPGPPPPPRPPKTPIDEDGPAPGFKVPPPFLGERKSSAPPPPPSRGPVPPPPPSRDAVAPMPGPPPSLPPKGAAIPPPPPPPPPPGRSSAPALPPLTSRPIPPPPSSAGGIPPPPPLPSSSGPPPPPPLPPPSAGGLPPPPPPMPPSTSGLPPPPPPPPPPGSDSPAPPLPKAPAGAGGRDDLLAAIRGTGTGGLRKVRDTDKRDRSAAAVPGSEAAAATPSSSAAAGGAAPAAPEAGLAGALAAALSQRKKKVSGSDDEKEDDDDW